VGGTPYVLDCVRLTANLVFQHIDLLFEVIQVCLYELDLSENDLYIIIYKYLQFSKSLM
jgi:hypothetical protein